MSRYRYVVTIEYRNVIEVEDGTPRNDVRENAVEEALQAIELDSLHVTYTVELTEVESE